MRTQFKTTFIGYLLSYHRRYMFTSSLSIWGFYDSLLKINVSLKCLNHDQLPAVVQLLHLKDFLVFHFPSNFCLFFPVKPIKRKTEHRLAWRYTQRLKHMKGVNTDIEAFFPHQPLKEPLCVSGTEQELLLVPILLTQPLASAEGGSPHLLLVTSAGICSRAG